MKYDEALNILDDYNLKYRSCHFEIKNGKRIAYFAPNHMNNFIYGSSGNYINTGTKDNNNIIVIDIDNINKCKDLVKLCNQSNTLTIQTPHGLHYYFEYTPQFNKTYHFKYFSILTNGALVFAPPTNNYKFKNIQSIKILPNYLKNYLSTYIYTS